MTTDETTPEVDPKQAVIVDSELYAESLKVKPEDVEEARPWQEGDPLPEGFDEPR